MRIRLGFIGGSALFFLLPAILMAQAPGLSGNFTAPTANMTQDGFRMGMMGARHHKTLAAIVYDPEGRPVNQAAVEISNNVGVPLRVLYTDRAGEIQADYDFFGGDTGKDFVATIKVSKKGYDVLHKVAVMEGSVNNLGLALTLHTPQSDSNPNLLSQQELINGVAPRFRNLGPADGLTRKGEKDYARAVQDFLDHHHLDPAVPRFLKVTEVDPNCLKCSTMLSLAELAWGDWDDPKRDLGKSITAITNDPKLAYPEPFLIYGALWEWRGQPQKAVPYFHKAAEYAPHDALALLELGRAQCLSMDFWDANESLQKALAAGAGPEARLLRAQALEWIGNPGEAMAEMNRYLDGRSPRSLSPRFRDLYEQIRAGKKDQTIVAAMKARAKASGVVPLDYLHHPPEKLSGLVPASDQKPLKDILAAVGKNEEQLFATLPDIVSTENVNQERLTNDGKSEIAQERKYRYLMVVPDQRWGPGIEEYRADFKGRLTNQPPLDDNYMLTEGFVSTPLVFYPAYQEGSSFRLLGTQDVNGRKTYVVVFAQRPGKTPISGSFTYGAMVRRIFTQGMAWIDADNYQVIRMVTDLLDTLPEIRLDKEHTDITFDKVNFKQSPQGFWLPKEVTVNLDWNGRLLRNEHSYSDFLLSNVESHQKISNPKDADKADEDAATPKAAQDTHGKKSPRAAPTQQP